MPLRSRGIYQTDGGSKDDFTILPTVETKKTFDGHIGQPKNPVIPATGVYQADGFDETDNFRINLTECSPNSYFSLGDMLSCPKCRKTFNREHHLDLLEHMEECDWLGSSPRRWRDVFWSGGDDSASGATVSISSYDAGVM